MSSKTPPSDTETSAGKTPDGKPEPRRVRLPGFVSDEAVGLGDAVKRTTSRIGIQPCGGCSRRAAWLNSRFVISSRRR
jgi:hypothetical protein